MFGWLATLSLKLLRRGWLSSVTPICATMSKNWKKMSAQVRAFPAKYWPPLDSRRVFSCPRVSVAFSTSFAIRAFFSVGSVALLRSKTLLMSSYVSFKKTGFHSVYYSTAICYSENLVFWNNSLYLTPSGHFFAWFSFLSGVWSLPGDGNTLDKDSAIERQSWQLSVGKG